MDPEANLFHIKGKSEQQKANEETTETYEKQEGPEGPGTLT